MLLRERLRERDAREAAANDQDLAQQASGLPLFLERVLEVVRREQTLLDEKRPEWTPGKVRLVHPIEYRLDRAKR